MNVIFYNAQIYPQSPIRKRPTVLVITGNRIEDVVDDLAAVKTLYPKHQRINLKGRAVIPGLVDSHTHFYFWASTLNAVHLDGIPTFAEALSEIRKFAQSCSRNDFIFGDGWSADRWQPYHLPTAQELDSVTGGRTAALYSKDQHMMWANSKALELAGIDRRTPDPEGGRIDRDEAGNPTGLLREWPAYGPVLELFKRPKAAQLERSWKKAVDIVYARGVTGFHTVDDSPDAWPYFQKRHRDGRLGFRVNYYFPVGRLDELIEKKIQSGMGDETLQIGGVKIFTDGSLGSQTAYMKKPYRGKSKDRGVSSFPLDRLIKTVGKADRNKLACAIHAIGDQAVADVITAYEQAERDFGLRHRIEHLQIIAREDIPRLCKTGVVASMQPSHCPSDRILVPLYWGNRGRNAYIFKTLMKRNVPLAFGSDCPIERLDPIYGIHAAVNRNGYGERGGRFYPEECLTVAQAVYGFTVGAAYAAGREAYAGRIVAGYQADLVILNDNIYTMPPSKIYTAKPAVTIFDGRVVYHDGSIKALH